MKRLNKSKVNEAIGDGLNTKSSENVLEEKPPETVKKSVKVTSSLTKRFCTGLSLILIFGIFIILSINSNYTVDIIKYRNIDSEILVLLKQYDRNDDGLLDVEEFEPIAIKLLNFNVSFLKITDEYINIVVFTDNT
jgi:hypothetical protein